MDASVNIPPRRRLRFSLRTTLVAVAVLSVAAGFGAFALLTNWVAGYWNSSTLSGFPAREYGNALEQEMIEAAFDGRLEKVKTCIAKGARVDARYGADSNYFRIVDGGVPVAGSNWTALMAATENDRFEVIEYLITQGASVRMHDGYGATPLYVLADKQEARQEYDPLAALLIIKGADVNAKTDIYIDGPDNTTALHRAVGWGHVEIVKLLLAAGADVNAETSWNCTPLDELVEGRNDGKIRAILLAAGAKGGTKRGLKERGFQELK